MVRNRKSLRFIWVFALGMGILPNLALSQAPAKPTPDPSTEKSPAVDISLEDAKQYLNLEAAVDDNKVAYLTGSFPQDCQKYFKIRNTSRDSTLREKNGGTVVIGFAIRDEGDGISCIKREWTKRGTGKQECHSIKNPCHPLMDMENSRFDLKSEKAKSFGVQFFKRNPFKPKYDLASLELKQMEGTDALDERRRAEEEVEAKTRREGRDALEKDQAELYRARIADCQSKGNFEKAREWLELLDASEEKKDGEIERITKALYRAEFNKIKNLTENAKIENLNEIDIAFDKLKVFCDSHEGFSDDCGEAGFELAKRLEDNGEKAGTFNKAIKIAKDTRKFSGITKGKKDNLKDMEIRLEREKLSAEAKDNGSSVVSIGPDYNKLMKTLREHRLAVCTGKNVDTERCRIVTEQMTEAYKIPGEARRAFATTRVDRMREFQQNRYEMMMQAQEERRNAFIMQQQMQAMMNGGVSMDPYMSMYAGAYSPYSSPFMLNSPTFMSGAPYSPWGGASLYGGFDFYGGTGLGSDLYMNPAMMAFDPYMMGLGRGSRF